MNRLNRPDRERQPSLPDARSSAWYRFTVQIEDLLATGRLEWARPTLEGIRATVDQQHRVTPAQIRAIKIIATGVRRVSVDDWIE
jgi:hypothetical protein